MPGPADEPVTPTPTDSSEGREVSSALRKERIRGALFKKSPRLPRIERFTLLERVGIGGMSEVFAAYDERLDRKIAIKLLRPGHLAATRASERLLREAQTLARLSHPNVVQVYDAGRFQDQVYVAMEFVRGQTLDRWVAEMDATRARDRRRAVLRQLVAVGRGLQAAHEAGLTHRDIKPHNVIVGADGRARVLDFGLASPRRPAADSEAEAAPESRPRAVDTTGATVDTETASTEEPITPPDALMGTPAYMAPELFLGQPASPSSDQFSFCVTAHEALCGARPYPDTSIEAVHDDLLDAPTLAAGMRRNRLPRPVRQALLRGLRADPERRHADMGQLLDALEGRPRRRLLIGAVAALLVIAVALRIAGVFAPSPAPVCQGAERELADVWTPAQKERVRERLLATELPFAGDTWQRVERDVETFIDDWQSMHRDACLAHHEGRQSDTLLDARMACLRDRRAALASALALLQRSTSGDLTRVAEILYQLPSPAYCGDLDALTAEVPPPEDPQIARAVDEIRAQLGEVGVLESAGEYRQARELAEQLAERARPLGYLPVLAEVRLRQGRILIRSENGDLRAQAMPVLEEAVQLGFQAGDHAVAVRAYARLLFIRSTKGQLGAGGLALATALVPLAESLDNGVRAHALLLGNLGVAHMALARRDQARGYHERALAAAEGRAPPLAQLARQNLVLVTADPAERARLAGELVDELTRTHGPSHPRTLDRRIVAASYIDDPQVALDTLAPACTALASKGYDNDDALVRCLLLQGFLSGELGHGARAAAELRAALPAAGRSPQHRLSRVVAPAYAELYDGRAEAALRAFEGARAGLPEAPKRWWQDADHGEVYLGLGTSALALARHDTAIAALERALPMFERLVERSYNAGYRHRLAWVRFALARALVAREGQLNERASALSDAADTWYRQTASGWRASELRAWRERQLAR